MELEIRGLYWEYTEIRSIIVEFDRTVSSNIKETIMMRKQLFLKYINIIIEMIAAQMQRKA